MILKILWSENYFFDTVILDFKIYIFIILTYKQFFILISKIYVELGQD